MSARRGLAAALVLAAGALAPAPAQGHSIVRERADRLSYLAADATSLNTLTARVSRGRFVLRDTTVDGGIDPGPCRPLGVSLRTGTITSVACPARGTAEVRFDLGDREDTAVVSLPVPVVLRGGPGADELAAGPAGDRVLGGDGGDRLAGAGGPDRVEGGSGDDTIGGEEGDDALDGGLGRDLLDGGAGDDAVRARDGQADEVRCGAGADRVEADTLDVATDCERVERAPVPPPPEAGPAGADERSPDVRAGADTVQPASRVTLLATSGERGVLSAAGFLAVGGRFLPVHGDRRQVEVGGGGATLRVRLGPRARRAVARALRRGRRATLRMAVVGTDRAGNSRLVRVAPILLGRPRARAAHPEPGDRDGDGVADPDDNCLLTRNADQADLDRDGMGDLCDADADGDGAEAAGGDNCTLAANPDQRDANRDGFGDACDRDSDGDGLRDPVDSCPTVPEDPRTNLDGDRQSDGCDRDDDEDGVFDDRDRCPRAPDPLQADLDRDGLGGACDPDEPPRRRWRRADGPWPADRTAPRVRVRSAPIHRGGGALVVRVACSERCFATATATLRGRGAASREAAGALAGAGETYVFVRVPRRRQGRGRVDVEVSDPFGNAVRVTRRVIVRR